jgi:stage III sporulation protein AH
MKMNTKRQTVWLVSMLSIMVVLSAYYLFTSDIEDKDMNLASDQLETHDIVLDSMDSGIVEFEENKDTILLDDLDNTEQNKTDEEILKEVQAQQESGYGYFTTLHLERDEAFAEELEKLYAVTVNGDAAAQSEAHDQIYKMDDQFSKLSHLEELIMKDFANAIITEDEENKWKVIVQTDSMEKSQAVTIIDMVMKEMNAGPNQVVVEMKK